MSRERIHDLRKEADKLLFSDGGKQWPIFRIRDNLYEDFWLFFERYIAATQRLKPPTNEKSGKLNLPPYHPRHKNPIIYDDEVKEYFDSAGQVRKDKCDVVRSALEG
jgi:hypothetical protein